MPSLPGRRPRLPLRPLGFFLVAGSGSGLYDPDHRIESARLYGNLDFYAYYYVDLLVGTPAQRVSVILDSGSGVCAFPCAGCAHCGQHIDPAFDFSRSSTARWAPCGSGCTGTCSNDKCSYYQGYTEGSSITGFWFQDFVSLGDTIQHNPAVIARMGCHNNENNLFYTQKANGILGVGPNGRGGRTLIQELFEDHPHVEGSVFAMCLAEWGGRLVVGGHNATYHTGPIKYVPLRTNTGYYGVPLTGMYLGGLEVSTHFGTAMIDSGTTYTYLGTGPYQALRSAIVSYCRGHDDCGAVNVANCWTLSSPEGLGRFPGIEVAFEEVRTVWVPKAYLYRRGSSMSWCYAFENDGPNANTVLGASWMLHQDIILDMRSHQVGIAPADCPEFRQRPAPPTAAQVSTRPALVTSTASTTTTAAATPTSAPTTTARPPTLTATSTVTSTKPATSMASVDSTSASASATAATSSSSATTVLLVTVAERPPPAASALSPAATGGEGGGEAELGPAASPREGGSNSSAASSSSSSSSSAEGSSGSASSSGSGPGSAPSRPAAPGRGAPGSAAEGGPSSSAVVLGGAAALLLALGGGCLCRRVCQRQHRYVQQKDDESGMPPQIVGSVTGDLSPGGATFVIDDADQWGEEDGFDCASDKPMHDFVPGGRVDKASAKGNAYVSDSDSEAHQANGPGAAIGAPVFTGGNGEPDSRLTDRPLD